MPRHITPSIAGTAAVAAALALAACGGSSTHTSSDSTAPGSLAGQSITLYNGQHEQTTARARAARSNGTPA